MTSAATEQRPLSQHSFLPPLTTIINDNEFPTLGARGTPSSGGFSPSPSGSLPPFSVQSQSPLQFKESNHRSYGIDFRPSYPFSGRLSNDGPAIQEPPRLNAGAWAHGGGSLPYANLIRSTDSSMNNPEFQIQSEDFPALPGAPAPSQQGQDLSAVLASSANSTSTNDMLVTPSQPPEPKLNFASVAEPSKGIVTQPDGEVLNIPPSMLADQYGMAGLVTYLRTVDSPSIVSLALGYDLTTLGLNLNLSERHLYSTFGGPWADTPIRPHEQDVKVPEEYLTNIHIRDKLPPVKLNKLSEDVLFYLFYNCPGEVYQLAAACELYSRDWRFHKTDGLWLTRSQYGGVKEQTTTFERGQYNVFDPLQWRKIPKELKLEYKELEERPKLPAIFMTGTLQPQQPVSTPANVGGAASVASQRHAAT